jgi:predicted HTH transcriptional regulator
VKPNPELQRRVDEFVRDLEVLIRKAAFEAVAEALGQEAGEALPPRTTSDKRVVGRPKAADKAEPSAGRVRRSAAQIEATAAKILAYVSENPGARAETIKEALNLSAKEWGLPVQRLIAEGKIATKGAKRATTYSLKK